jgi:hypothetical protein
MYHNIWYEDGHCIKNPRYSWGSPGGILRLQAKLLRHLAMYKIAGKDIVPLKQAPESPPGERHGDGWTTEKRISLMR